MFFRRVFGGFGSTAKAALSKPLLRGLGMTFGISLLAWRQKEQRFYATSDGERKIQDQERSNADQCYKFLSKEKIAELQKEFPKLRVVDHAMLPVHLTRLRDKSTDAADFRRFSDRIVAILFEDFFAHEAKTVKVRESPMGYFEGEELAVKDHDYCIVTVLRAGDVCMSEVIRAMPNIPVGKLLIQRNEEKPEEANRFYQKLPRDITSKRVILFDPMLATGGSLLLALKMLNESGVRDQDITFINIIACREGLARLYKQHPDVHVVTANVDPVLVKPSMFLAPGLGDFGDRYFGTN